MNRRGRRLNDRKKGGSETGEAKARSVLQRPAIKVAAWIGGIFLASLGGVLTASITGLFQNFVPTPHEISCFVSQWFEKDARDDEFAVIVATLKGDKDGHFGNILAHQIREQTGLGVLRTCRTISLSSTGSRYRASEHADEEGWVFLRKRNADLMVWGEIEPGSASATLWVSRRNSPNITLVDGDSVSEATIAKFVNERLGGDIWWDMDRVIHKRSELPVIELQKALKKFEALSEAKGVRSWTGKPYVQTSYAMAAICLEIYKRSVVKDVALLERSIREAESAFFVANMDPLSSLNYQDGPRAWRQCLCEGLFMLAEAKHDMPAMEKGIRLASAVWNEDSQKGSGLASDNEFADYNFRAFQISKSPEYRQECIKLYTAVILRMRKTGHAFGTQKTSPELLGGGKEGDIKRIEEHQAYERLSLLGGEPDGILLRATSGE